MAHLDESSAPDDGQRQAAIAFTSTPTASPEQPRAGFDWNGPMGFWIAMPLAVAIVIALGLLLQ